jgi:phospho-acceptor domain-containing protein
MKLCDSGGARYPVAGGQQINSCKIRRGEGMTQGTSTHGDGLSARWTDVGQAPADSTWRRWAGCDGPLDRAGRAAGTAPLQLLALSAMVGLVLGLLINLGWPAAVDSGSGGASALHLVVLIATCMIGATVALRPGDRAPLQQQDRQEQGTSEGPGRLLAQMHHELRTPLNAMIGFSEVMLRELHGPLGHARYQEYAAHISESGGRLLKASEDALAVAATMSALVAGRRALQRERLPAAALLQEAWAVSGASRADVRLRMDVSGAADIECDPQATSEALQHLLGEAAFRTPAGGAIIARGGRHSIEIVVEPVAPAQDRVRSPADATGRPTSRSAAGDGLRLILARSLIEMQGATLSLSAAPKAEGWAEGWTARVVFAERLGRKQEPNAGSRWPGLQARRGDCAAGVAIRASAGSHAAPPA